MQIDVRREQVLDAALKLIAARGYSDATMDAIATEAGVAKPVLYGAFAGRDAPLNALLEREERRGLNELADAFATAGAVTPRARRSWSGSPQ